MPYRGHTFRSRSSGRGFRRVLVYKIYPLESYVFLLRGSQSQHIAMSQEAPQYTPTTPTQESEIEKGVEPETKILDGMFS